MLSLVPKTFMHAHASTRICDSNTTIIRQYTYVRRRRRQIYLRSVFGVNQRKYIRLTQQENTHSNHPFKTCKHFRNHPEIAIRTCPKINTFMRFTATGSNRWGHFRRRCRDLHAVCLSILVSCLFNYNYYFKICFWEWKYILLNRKPCGNVDVILRALDFFLAFDTKARNVYGAKVLSPIAKNMTPILRPIWDWIRVSCGISIWVLEHFAPKKFQDVRFQCKYGCHMGVLVHTYGIHVGCSNLNRYGCLKVTMPTGL